MENNSKEITQQLTLEDVEKMLSQIELIPDTNQKEILSGMSSVLGTRESQQDSCYVESGPGGNAVGIVCDGMGGLSGGEFASQNAVKTFVEDFEEIRYETDNYYDFFRNEMVDIDIMISHLKDDQGRYLNAGTTLVAVAVTDGYLQWVSVGDSKIYIIRGNDMVCVTKEHNYFMLLNDKLLEGSITDEEYQKEARRGAALISYLGMGNVSLMDLNPNPLQLLDGDIVLLCSDGLYKALSEDEIYAIVKKDPLNIEQTLQKLQSEAKKASVTAQDNTSIVMLLYRE